MYVSYFSIGVAGFLITRAKKIKIFKGYLYSSTPHMIPFVSDVYRYVPLKINNISGDLNIDTITVRRNFIWGTLEIY